MTRRTRFRRAYTDFAQLAAAEGRSARAPFDADPDSREVVAVSAERQGRLYDEALQECAAALEELEAYRTEWLAYEEQDQPAYVAWLHAHFGPRIQEIREAVEQIEIKRRVIEAVEDIVVEQDCGYTEAYAVYLKRRGAAGPDAEAAPEFDFDGADADAEGESPGAGSGREGSSSSSSSSEWKQRGMPRASGPARSEASPELKAIYRTLARKLHPDVSGLAADSHQRAAQLWFQVQEAYEAGDLGRLQALAGIADTIHRGTSRGVSGADASGGGGGGARARVAMRISDILGATRKYRKAARAIQRDLDRARRTDPAFGFFLAREKKAPQLRKQARRELDSELAEAREAVEALDRFIQQWERGAERLRDEWQRKREQGGRSRGRSRSGRGGGGRGRRR